MAGAIEASASSLVALGEEYRAIVNNLANSNTAGYKRQMTRFALELQRAGSPIGAEEAFGSITSQLLIDHTQGPLTQTGRPLDLAVSGKGFFVLETPEGPLYTRNGAFRVNAQRQLVDVSNRIVAGESGPLVLPSGASTSQVAVGADGTVGAAGTDMGRLKIVEFDDTASLEPVGGNCFRAADGGSGQPATASQVQQGFQEASNVNVMEELAGLITVTKLYEANVKSIRVQDEKTKSLIDVAMS
jgi:flagellar basal-body rod protein FlgF